jgi:hypothetical protein
MGMKPAIVAALSLLATGSVAAAEERLVLQPYPSGTWYDVVNQSGPGGFIHEQLPQGQTTENAQDVLTAQSRRGFRGSPAAFITLAFSDLAQNCDTVETVGPTVGEEAGRQVAYGRFYCGKQKGQPYGAHIFFKAILGSEALYIIDRDFRIPASEHPSAPALPEDQAVSFLQTEAQARKYLTDQVYVCDPVFPEPRCTGEAVPTGK